MSAREIWDELASGGWLALSRWRADKRTEGLHLDFKQANWADVTARKLKDDDVKNLARSLSAFANTEGGVIVFGALAKAEDGKAEVLKALPGIEQIERYADALRAHLLSATTPVVHGVRVEPLPDPQHPERGVVTVYVPMSDGAPHRAEGPDPTVSKRYYIRTTTDTDVMSHQLLSAMFGRRPHPRFRVGLYWREDDLILVKLENIGPGAAVMPMLRLRLVDRSNSYEPFGLGSINEYPWENRHQEILHGAGENWDLAVLLPMAHRLYRGEARIAASIKLFGTSPLICVRVDCENAPPHEAEDRLVLAKGQTTWMQRDE